MVRRRRSRRVGGQFLKASALGGALSMAGVMPLMADTDVEFSGKLVSAPCQVDTESEKQTVEFWPVVTKHFLNNEQSYPADFSIRLRECDLSLGTQVTVTFLGDKNSIKPGLFALTGTTEGLALAITDSAGRPVLPGEGQQPVALTGTDNDLTWQARLQSTGGYGTVTEGEFLAVITFQLEYE